MSGKNKKWISGFWRRIAALLIDMILISTIGFILGFFFKPILIRIENWGILIGYAITLTYFGVMTSNLNKGQTLGKKILKLRVVDSKNQTITLKRSFIRYFILIIPSFAISIASIGFIGKTTALLLTYPLSLVFLCVFLVMIFITFSVYYLYIFNRVTRQSLHDLIVGTYVVNENVEKQEVGKVWIVHLVIVALLLVTAAVLTEHVGRLMQSDSFQKIMVINDTISNEPEVASSSASISSTFIDTDTTTQEVKTIKVTAVLVSDLLNDAKLAQRLATIVVANAPKPRSKDMIMITLKYGYNIGIWDQYHSNTYRFTPSELQGKK